MPLIFREDGNGGLRYSGLAIVDDLGHDDLPGPDKTLIIEDGKEAFVERVGGGSRHATSDQVTLAEFEHGKGSRDE